MIASWMIASTVFAALLGIAALAIDRALRSAGRQARGAWLAALVCSIGWTAVAPAVSSAISRLTHVELHAPVSSASPSPATIVAPATAAPRSWTTYLDLPLVALWALASLVLLARLAWAMRALSRMERAADRSVIDGVPVLVTESVGPAVFGTGRSRVLIPRWLLELDAPLRELVLRHEQEHCRARDPQLTLTVAVAVVLMPWNAAVWWIARRLRLAVELDCDTRVLRVAQDTERYSKLLLFIAQRQSIVRLAPMLAESNSHLGRRIAAMNSTRPNNPRARMFVFSAVAIGAMLFSTRFAGQLTAAPSFPRAVPQLNQTVSRRRADPDRFVTAMPGAKSPRYPDTLRQSGVTGGVLVAFIVDTNGVVDPQSMKVFVSSHPLFTESVREVLPDWRFLPAVVNGKKVKQVVRMPVVFNLSGSTAKAAEFYTTEAAVLLADPASSKFVALPAVLITGIVP